MGARLASLESLLLITGGMKGIGEGVARSFFESRQCSAHHRDVFHVLPRGSGAWDYGITLFAGADLAERREVLARLASLYLIVEGGPGTVHEATVARAHGAHIIPVGCSGGHAGELYPVLTCPAWASPNAWKVLGDPMATPEQIACAVCDLVTACLETLTRELH